LLSDEEPVTLAEIAVSELEAACARLDERYRRIYSRAGHDTMNMARRWPAAMLFVPSRAGVSHHPNEYTAPEQIAAGARVLHDAMLHAALNSQKGGPR
jgi:acetylornithine deacetylase/succinyl-diaminopimelate desuccinylase-like protein